MYLFGILVLLFISIMIASEIIKRTEVETDEIIGITLMIVLFLPTSWYGVLFVSIFTSIAFLLFFIKSKLKGEK